MCSSAELIDKSSDIFLSDTESSPKHKLPHFYSHQWIKKSILTGAGERADNALMDTWSAFCEHLCELRWNFSCELFTWSLLYNQGLIIFHWQINPSVNGSISSVVKSVNTETSAFWNLFMGDSGRTFRYWEDQAEAIANREKAEFIKLLKTCSVVVGLSSFQLWEQSRLG